MLSAGLTGVQRGMQGLEQSARNIASASSFSGRGEGQDSLNDITIGAVTDIKNRHQVEASVQVLKVGNHLFETTNKIVGSQIDLKA